MATSPTELTTGLTDGILAVECFVVVIVLARLRQQAPWRMGLWTGIFGLTAISSLLGAVVHGLALPVQIRHALWRPLYLSLGIVIALFVVAAIFDWRGLQSARRLLPWALAAGGLFFGLTELTGGDFLVFVLYEAVGMLSTLAIYTYLAVVSKTKGAGTIALAIFISLVAAGVQASNMSVWIGLPFDHNGLFHLIQMLSVGLLAYGVHLGVSSPPT